MESEMRSYRDVMIAWNPIKGLDDMCCRRGTVPGAVEVGPHPGSWAKRYCFAVGACNSVVKREPDFERRKLALLMAIWTMVVR